MSKCKFTTEYDDEIEPGVTGPTQFTCEESALDSGFCIYHDEQYYKEKPENLCNAILDKIKTHNSYLKPIYLIGYHIPEIIIKQEFLTPTYFTQSQFHGATNFSESIFYKKTNFDKTSFEDAKFIHTEFRDSVQFVKSFFSSVEFAGTTFGYSVFSGSKFIKSLFLKCKIGHTFFAGATFKDGQFPANNFGYVSFYNTIFENGSFINSRFEDAEFQSTKFQEIDFSGTEFEAANFSGTLFKQKANFEKVFFSNQDRIKFNGNLSNVSFLDSDVSRVRFGSNTTWGGKDKFTIINEKESRKHPEKADLHAVLAIYRSLRENYEYRLRYDEAGEFFVKEMNLKREYEAIP